MNCIYDTNWAEFWLVNKYVMLFGSKTSRWKKLFTLLDVGAFFDMHLMIFNMNSQYLVRFSQYLVKNH